VSIVHILYIVYIPYARDMHRKEFLLVRIRIACAACPKVADNGFIPARLQNQSIKLTEELCEAPCEGTRPG